MNPSCSVSRTKTTILSTQKPIALLDRIIRASSNVGDLVLDPFSGSFTTAYVAKELGRRCIGIELQDEYIKFGRYQFYA